MRRSRILLIQLRQLGDILLTTPCIRELRAHYRDAHISFLSHKMGRLILENNPYINEFFVYDEKEGLGAQIRLIKTLRARGYETVIDFMNNPRSALFALATGAPERIAFPSSRRLAYNTFAAKPEQQEYIVREKFRLLKPLDVDATDIRLTLPWFEQHAAATIKFLHETKELREAPIRVILSPTHRREMRQWDIARYAQLSDRLVREWGATVTWLWGPGEEELVDRARALCKEQSFRAPPTTFREMAALIANHDLFIGNSNGPSHVAVSTGIASLQLHGHTSAISWCPLNDLHRAVQSPWQHSNPEKAMEAISIDDVWLAAQGIKPSAEKIAAARKQIGFRLKWQA